MRASQESDTMLRSTLAIAALVFAGCLGSAPTTKAPGSDPAPAPTTNGDTSTPGASTPAAPPTTVGPTAPTADPTVPGSAPSGDTSGGMGNTFDHPHDEVDPFAVLNRIQQQG